MKDTQEAWRAMEMHVPDHTRTLGISNVYQIEDLRALYHFAIVKPSVVQNRFYSATGFDADIRTFCAEKGMTYQSFWTLTANPGLLKSKAVASLSEHTGVSKAVALYGLVLGLGHTSVLTGTTNAGRMKEDLTGVEKIQKWSQTSPKIWKKQQDTFKAMVNV